MKKKILVISFIMIFASLTLGQEKEKCDCKIVPYTPSSCFGPCTESIVNEATLEELIYVAKFGKETAQKIVNFRISKAKNLKTIEEYRAIFTNDKEFEKFKENLESFNDNQTKYFQTPTKTKERREYRIQLKKLSKASDALDKIGLQVNTQVREGR